MATTTFRRVPSVSGSLAPSYTTTDDHGAGGGAFELTNMGAGGGGGGGASSTASLDVDGDDDTPPPYSHDARFAPTVHLQIQTAGKQLFSFPAPPKPEPIPVYGVVFDGISGAGGGSLSAAPAYLSLRRTRGSGSCTLVSVTPGAGADEHTPVSTTAYRFGPGRNPRVRLIDPRDAAASAIERDLEGEADDDGSEGEGADGVGGGTWDGFEIASRGLLTRAKGFRTRLGTFEWRYAGRKERRAAGADNLLVLDRVVRVFRARGSAGAKEDEERTPVARFVRNAELRTPGSSPSTAGNGGRLQIDLSLWGAEEKTERMMLEVMVVTTCISMLKKEVDRRRAHQIAVMGAAAGAH